MKKQFVWAFAVLVLSAGIAAAGVTPIGPFTGYMSETFEHNLGNGTYPEVPLFDGSAVLDDTLSGIAVITNWWNGTGGQLLPYEGTLFGGTPTGSQIITFGTPALDFGGFIGTVSDTAGATVVFRDPLGNLIDQVTADITPVTWKWIGWSSDTPIGSIQITGNGPMGNRPVQFDNLEVNFVPEPASLALLGLGGLALLRRRR